MSDIKLTYDGVTTYYNYQGDKLLSQYNQNDDGSIDEVIFFLYDGDDNIIGMNYDGNFYYYQKNVLSDVIAVYDANGVCVAEYEYDAWGNVIYQSGGQNKNLAIDYINPIRYRSYYYENSVGMYYLQSRYYYATAGRFINADDPQIALDSKEDTDGTNLFAYCCNDPVNNVDVDGKSATTISTIAVAKLIVDVVILVSIIITVAFVLEHTDFDYVISRIKKLCNEFRLTLEQVYKLLKKTFISTYRYSKRLCLSKSKTLATALTVSTSCARVSKRIKKDKKYNYWKATRKSINGYKYVEIGNGIYENSAISRMKNNKDVFCSSKSKAKSIAKRAGNGKKPVGPEIDRGKNSVAGFYYHYHPHARMYQSHSFYA